MPLPAYLYHGTTSAVLDDLLIEGIMPRNKTGRNAWSHTVPSRDDAVYLTSAYALYFAINSSSNDEDIAIVEIATSMLDAGDPAIEDLCVRQNTTQRDDDVPRLEVAGRRLGQERLVRHVRQRIDDRHHCFVPAELALQAQRGVKAHVAAADDQDVRSLTLCHTYEPIGASVFASSSTSSSMLSVSLPVKVFCWLG